MIDKRIIALGFFDGVHRGHGQLLTQCRKMADTHHCKAAAVTFSNHPDGLVFGKSPELINTDADRSLLMQKKYGIDEVLMLPFDKKMMNMPWRDFFDMLCREYKAAGIVCGHDFCFGARGEGNAQCLKQACAEAGMPCEVIPEQKIDGITISSTHIRSLLQDGQVEQAAEFLGHYHMISGQVISGRKLGRTLGIPTANIAPKQNLVQLKHGVYACRVHIEDEYYIAVTNVGKRPTVNGHHVTIEPWILDFDGDLYGKDIRLSFHKFLRPEQKFASLEELKAAICEDEKATRAYFSNIKPDNCKILDVI